MSYDIRVVKTKDNSTVRFGEKHNISGHTYQVGGTDEAWLNVTYNFAPHFYRLWPEPEDKKEKDGQTPFGQMFGKTDGGIRSLYGKPLDETIGKLREAVGKLKGEPDDDPWKPTEGNARLALSKLLKLCEMAREEFPEEQMTLEGD